MKKKTQKEALGFDNGYITIFKGDTYPLKDWFKENGAKYTKMWGWSFAGSAAMPDELPLSVTPIRLDWDIVGEENGQLKPDAIVQAAVEDLLYDDTPSEYVGEIGDKVEFPMIVKQAIQLNGYYGPSTMHIFEDEDENVFVWVTTTKTLPENTWYIVKGTVKDHRTYKHTKQTVLTRCKVTEM